MTTRVLVVSSDHVGTRMAGPGIRAWRFAEGLHEHFDVTLTSPSEPDLPSAEWDVRVVDPFASRALTKLARDFDVVIAQRLPVVTMLALARLATRVIYDLYVPAPIEQLAFDAGTTPSRQLKLNHRLGALHYEISVAVGDGFVCASERQRNLLLGMLIATGRVNLSVYAAGPSLRQFVDVVPFGLDSTPPTHTRPVLRGVVPGIGDTDPLLLWGGGIWNWLDPLTVIYAVDRLRHAHPDLRLYFLGQNRPNPLVSEMSMADRAIRLASELELIGTHVFFNRDWVPHAELGSYLLEADVGVAAHSDDLEAQFAFRTRLVDCIWASLPMVTSRGDALGDLVERHGLGRTAPPGDVDAYAAALDTVLSDAGLRARLEPHFAALRHELEWPRVLKPLVRMVERDREPAPVGRVYSAAAAWVLRRGEHAIRARGLTGATRRAASIALRRRPGQPVARSNRG